MKKNWDAPDFFELKATLSTIRIEHVEVVLA